MKTVDVTTACGLLRGINENGVNRFLGIRYGKAERFAYPAEVTHWDGVYEAFDYGDAPIQKDAYDPADSENPENFYAHEMMKGVKCTYSEDCLNLNIYAPENAENAPVLIVIFGGGEVSGRTHELPYDATALAKKGIISVFISYRLNIFGFICLRQLAERDGHSGNYAYYDQYTAINWVRHNIASFGGDVSNMTLAGQSAGAANCETQIKSPLNKGVFRQAVIQSSAGFVTGLKTKDNRESEYAKWQKIYEQSGARSLDEFISLSAEKLFSLFDEESSSKPGFCTTVYSEDFGGSAKNEPCDTKIMIGITSDDVFPLLLYHFSNVLCRTQAEKGIETYRYFFRHRLPSDAYGAWHGSDLWYFYGALGKCWRKFEREDEELAEIMQRYAVNFMKTGNPNGKGLPAWKPMNEDIRSSMMFDTGDIRMGRHSLWQLAKATVASKAPKV